MLCRKMGLSEADPIDMLSDRQLEIFRFIGVGKGTHEISKILHLSIHTVESHRENIKRILGVKTSPELLRMAVLWSTN